MASRSNARIAPEFTDADVIERTHYMVMYRADRDGMSFYPAAGCDASIVARMIQRGHVERVEQGYRMTEAGRRAWAQMCAYIGKHAASSVAGQSELRDLIAEEQAWRKYLSPGQERGLRDLLEHPRAPGHFHKQTLAYLLERGWVAWDMKMIAITEKGRFALDRFDSRQRRAKYQRRIDREADVFERHEQIKRRA